MEKNLKCKIICRNPFSQEISPVALGRNAKSTQMVRTKWPSSPWCTGHCSLWVVPPELGCPKRAATWHVGRPPADEAAVVSDGCRTRHACLCLACSTPRCLHSAASCPVAFPSVVLTTGLCVCFCSVRTFLCVICRFSVRKGSKIIWRPCINYPLKHLPACFGRKVTGTVLLWIGKGKRALTHTSLSDGICHSGFFTMGISPKIQLALTYVAELTLIMLTQHPFNFCGLFRLWRAFCRNGWSVGQVSTVTQCCCHHRENAEVPAWYLYIFW